MLGPVIVGIPVLAATRLVEGAAAFGGGGISILGGGGGICALDVGGGGVVPAAGVAWVGDMG